MSDTATPSDSTSSSTLHPSRAHEHFPWFAFVVAAAAFIVGDWFAAAVYAVAGQWTWIAENPGWFSVSAGIVTVIFVHLLWKENHHRPRHRSLKEKSIQTLLGMGVLVFGAWATLASEHWLESEPLELPHSPWLYLTVTGILFVCSGGLLRRFERRHVRPVDVEQPADRLRATPIKPGDADTGFKALILFVSTPNIVPAVATGVTEDGTHVLLRLPIGEVLCRLKGRSLADDIQEITKTKTFWNWQQLLRAIEPHRGLESVWLIGSLDAAGYQPKCDSEGNRLDMEAGCPFSATSGRGSYDYLGMCEKMLRAYLPDSTRIDSVPPAVNFEDFNALVDSVRTVLHRHLQHLPEHRILLDVTGGQKVTSIAGAALTLGNELRFQYVQTSGQFYPVRYDLLMERIPGLHDQA